MPTNELFNLPDLERRLEGLESKGKFDTIVKLAKDHKLSAELLNKRVKICNMCDEQTIRVLHVLSLSDPRNEHPSYAYFKELPITTTYELNIVANLKKIDPIIRNRLAVRLESLRGNDLKNELETAKALLAREGSRTVYEKDSGYNSDIDYKGNNILSKYEIRLCTKHNTPKHLEKIVSNRIEQFTTAFFGYIPNAAIKQTITKGPTGRKYDVIM
jgi:hypothetical protein